VNSILAKTARRLRRCQDPPVPSRVNVITRCHHNSNVKQYMVYPLFVELIASKTLAFDGVDELLFDMPQSRAHKRIIQIATNVD
jgi:hypothetical protein